MFSRCSSTSPKRYSTLYIFTNHIYSHVDVPRCYCRVLFVDFSSAFNTLQPCILVDTRLKINVIKHICAWILEFLTDRSQFVRFTVDGKAYFSSSRVINIGSPQGTCISPALFTLYTDDCRSECETVKIVKFADDTAILGLLNDSSESFNLFESEIDRFVSWCESHSLHLNVSKTKDMVIDFRLKGNEHDAIEIAGELVERVSDYKYLGVNVNDKLDWSVHAQNVMSKVNQRMYFVRKLYSFGVDSVLVYLFLSFTVLLSSLSCLFV